MAKVDWKASKIFELLQRQLKDYNPLYNLKGVCIANEAAPALPSAYDCYYYTGDVSATVFGVTGVIPNAFLIYSTQWNAVVVKIPLIVPEKTTFLKPGKNLFDKNACLMGRFITEVGYIAEMSVFNVSDYIEVLPSTQYAISHLHYHVFYDENKQYISGAGGNPTVSNTTIITPATAKYARFTLLDGNMSVMQIELGAINTNYEPFYLQLLKSNTPIKATDVTSEVLSLISAFIGQIKPLQTSFVELGKNLFDKDSPSIVFDYYINTGTGGLSPTGTLNSSDYIEILPSTQYAVSYLSFHAFYDENKIFISGTGSHPGGAGIIMTPENAKYARFTVVDSAMSNMQVELGSSNTNYEPYLLSIRNLNLLKNNKWYGLKWASLGDSITAGGEWQSNVVSYLGLNHVNCGISGTAVADSSSNSMWQDARVNAIPADAKLVTILGGTNDWARNTPLGLINSSNTNEFYGAFNTLIDKLLTRNPAYFIMLMTTTYGTYAGEGWNENTNLAGLTCTDYSEAVRMIAKKWGLPVIDTQQNCGWNSKNINTYIGDGLHPNSLGNKRMAEIVIGKLKSLDPISLV